jgi:hypothetical protein
MVRALRTAPKPAYEKFLFAAIGEDANSMSVTVLSVLARSDLDPWAEATALAFLPREMAAKKVLRIITGLPDIPPDQATLENAQRLVGLLPSIVHPEVSGLAFTNEKTIRLAAWAFSLFIVIAATIVIQWIYARHVADSLSGGNHIPHLISTPRHPPVEKH